MTSIQNELEKIRKKIQLFNSLEKDYWYHLLISVYINQCNIKHREVSLFLKKLVKRRKDKLEKFLEKSDQSVKEYQSGLEKAKYSSKEVEEELNSVDGFNNFIFKHLASLIEFFIKKYKSSNNKNEKVNSLNKVVDATGALFKEQELALLKATAYFNDKAISLLIEKDCKLEDIHAIEDKVKEFQTPLEQIADTFNQSLEEFKKAAKKDISKVEDISEFITTHINQNNQKFKELRQNLVEIANNISEKYQIEIKDILDKIEVSVSNYFDLSLDKYNINDVPKSFSEVLFLNNPNKKITTKALYESINSVLDESKNLINISEVPFPKHKITPSTVERPENYWFEKDEQSSREKQKKIKSKDLEKSKNRIELISHGYDLKRKAQFLMEQNVLSSNDLVEEENNLLKAASSFIEEAKDKSKKSLNLSLEIEEDREKLNNSIMRKKPENKQTT